MGWFYFTVCFFFQLSFKPDRWNCQRNACLGYERIHWLPGGVAITRMSNLFHNIISWQLSYRISFILHYFLRNSIICTPRFMLSEHVSLTIGCQQETLSLLNKQSCHNVLQTLQPSWLLRSEVLEWGQRVIILKMCVPYLFGVFIERTLTGCMFILIYTE